MHMVLSAFPQLSPAGLDASNWGTTRVEVGAAPDSGYRLCSLGLWTRPVQTHFQADCCDRIKLLGTPNVCSSSLFVSVQLFPHSYTTSPHLLKLPSLRWKLP